MTTARYPDPLPPKFERFGFTYRQIHRTPKCAVYEVRIDPEGSPSYEVVKPNISTQICIDGSWTPCSPYERYPSSEQWGSRAWTFLDKEKAMEKCESI
jgi:hypothetical protein